MALPVRPAQIASLESITNDAAVFKGFIDADILNAEQRTIAAINRFALVLRAGAATSILPPVSGGMAMSFPTDNVKPVDLQIDLNAAEQLKVARALTIDHHGVRMFLRFTDAALERVRERLWTHHAAGNLIAENLPQTQKERGGNRKPVTPDQQMRSWLNGENETITRFTVPLDQRELVILNAGEEVEIRAEVAYQPNPKTAPKIWYLINPGAILKALSVGPDDSLDTLAAQCTAMITRGPLAPIDRIDQLIAVMDLAKTKIVLQPLEEIPPAALSFTTFERFKVVALSLAEGANVYVRCEEPTITKADLRALNLRVTDAAPDVFRCVQAFEYLVAPVPDKRFDIYNELAQRVGWAQVGWREGGVAVERDGGVEVLLGLNATTRPQHPPWSARRAKQLRRLFPMRCVLNIAGTPVVLVQDRFDCIRHEFAFHMAFTDEYFQSYPAWTQDQRKRRVADPDRPHELTIVPAQYVDRPKLENFVLPIRIPLREHISIWPPTPRGLPSLHSYYGDCSAVNAKAHRWLAMLETRVSQYALEVKERLVHGPIAGDSILPVHTQHTVNRIAEILDNDSDKSHLDLFLAEQLATAIERLEKAFEQDPQRIKLHITSGWRSPEHNECVSETPQSNHQRGDALDIQPHGADPGNRNPLVQLCLHAFAQTLLPPPPNPVLLECLLERGPVEFIFGKFEPTLADMVIDAAAGNVRQYTYRDPGTVAADNILGKWEEKDGDQVTTKGSLDSKLVETFHVAYQKAYGEGMPWPSPTYRDVYIYGLCDASHVHHTFNPENDQDF